MARGPENSDTEARFNAVVEEFGRYLRATIARLCPRDLGLQLDDIEQEARLRLWRALDAEREIDDLASYIYRIAATTTIDALRRVKARPEEQLRTTEEQDGLRGEALSLTARPEDSPERRAEHQQVIGKVEQALARLPEDRRRAVGLYLEGLSSQEIADLLGWSEPRARNLTYRGLKDLRLRLRDEGIEYEID